MPLRSVSRWRRWPSVLRAYAPPLPLFFLVEFLTHKEYYMTWEQIWALHAAGFQVGNHTRSHAGVAKLTLERLPMEVTYTEEQCAKHGIPTYHRLLPPELPD